MKRTKSSNHTNRELAEAHIFPHGLSEKEKHEADKALLELRSQRWNSRSNKDQLRDNILQLKYQMEEVINSSIYRDDFHYGYFLASYIRLIGKKQKEFAQEISIDETRLSRIIHRKELPNEELFVRLELHSLNIIPAIYWFRLVEKGKAHDIHTNHERRKAEKKYVLKTI